MKRVFFVGMFVWLAAVVFGAGCATVTKKVVVFNERNDHVWLQYEAHKGEVVAQGYAHPATLTAAQFEAMLKAVHLEEYSFFKWRDNGRIFVEEERKKLAPRLVEAFAKATPDQWVHFAVSGHKRDLIFQTLMATDGVCYFKDGKFHLILGNVNLELIQPDKDKYNSDPRERYVFNSRRLQINPEKGYDKPPIDKGNPYFEKERRNWLVFDLSTFFTSVDAAIEQPAAPTPEPGDVGTRLQKLKELLDQGLITQEEYEQKRKQILEGL